MPPRRAATTLAADGGLVGSASLLNIFLIGGTHTGSAAPMAPKAHDQTTIGSRCKKVVQNPAIRRDVSRKDVREERVRKQKEKNEKKGRKRGKNHARETKRERRKKSESPL